MKIAIASNGKEETDKVHDTFGRAPYFLIFEDEKLDEAIKNPFAYGGGGAGIGAAQMLDDKGVEKVVGGKFGPNVVASLDEKGIDYEEINDYTVREALEKIL